MIVVIILNLNKSKDLIACLESVYLQNNLDKKIIIVDNGSNDDSVFLVKTKFPEVILLESKVNLGVAGGRNFGINTAVKEFDFRYIVFLDNDVVLDKNYLMNLVDSFSVNKDIGIAAPKCLSFQNPKLIEYAGGIDINFYTGRIKNIGSGKFDDTHFNKSRYLTACGGLFMTTKDVLKNIGMFDERFNPYGWEDVDFSVRVKKKGYKIFYNPRAIIYHKGGKKIRTHLASEYESYKIKNYFYLLRKHATVFQLFTLIFCLPFTLFLTFMSDMLTGNGKALIYKFKGLIEFSGFGKSNEKL